MRSGQHRSSGLSFTSPLKKCRLTEKNSMNPRLSNPLHLGIFSLLKHATHRNSLSFISSQGKLLQLGHRSLLMIFARPKQLWAILRVSEAHSIPEMNPQIIEHRFLAKAKIQIRHCLGGIFLHNQSSKTMTIFSQLLSQEFKISLQYLMREMVQSIKF